MSDLEQRLDAIKTREDLSKFVEVLAEGLRDRTLTWENSDLASFLEGMSAWIADMDGYFLNRGEGVPQDPSWGLIAQILVAASQYE